MLASCREALGIVNLEAMAAGKATIATRVGGVPEIIEHGRNGLLVPAGDVNALAGAMSQLIADAAFRRRLGDAGRKISDQFSWTQIVVQYEAIYCRSLQARS